MQAKAKATFTNHLFIFSEWAGIDSKPNMLKIV